MRACFYGLILNLQFFTVVPVRREISMSHKNIRGLIGTLPLLGLLLGVMYSRITYLLVEVTSLSTLVFIFVIYLEILLISFVIWLRAIVIIGAIHMESLIDTSYAFFFYRDRNRRLEIMIDVRTGAFGFISVIVLLFTKFLFIYEVMLYLNTSTYIFILFIPFFSRMLTAMMLILIPSAKEEGLGFFFQRAVNKHTLAFYVIYVIPISLILLLRDFNDVWAVLIMLMATLFTFLFLRRKVLQWFGGITGDVVGASQEGMEVLLRMIVWALHSFVMG